MTGMYLRVTRDDIAQNVEFEHLTAQELDDYIQAQPADAGWKWARALAKWIRDNVECHPCPTADEPTLDVKSP